MNAIAAYRTRKIDTASPVHVLVMLYQELLRRIELGAQQIDRGADAGAHFSHARKVLTELLAALDPDEGGEGGAELVQNLSSLYTWSAAELISAGRERDAVRARRVSDVLMPVLEGWTELLLSGAAHAGTTPSGRS
jgi:flagellar protein FliS